MPRHYTTRDVIHRIEDGVLLNNTNYDTDKEKVKQLLWLYTGVTNLQISSVSETKDKGRHATPLIKFTSRYHDINRSSWLLILADFFGDYLHGVTFAKNNLYFDVYYHDLINIIQGNSALCR